MERLTRPLTTFQEQMKKHFIASNGAELRITRVYLVLRILRISCCLKPLLLAFKEPPSFFIFNSRFTKVPATSLCGNKRASPSFLDYTNQQLCGKP